MTGCYPFNCTAPPLSSLMKGYGHGQNEEQGVRQLTDQLKRFSYTSWTISLKRQNVRGKKKFVIEVLKRGQWRGMAWMNKFIHHAGIIKRSQLFRRSMRWGQSFIVLMRERDESAGEDTGTQLKLHVHGSPPPREGQVIFARFEC